MTLTSTLFPPADRIASFKPYFFAALGKKIVDLKSKGLDVIRIDMGSPDLPPADFIIDTLVNSAAGQICMLTPQTEVHRHSKSRGRVLRKPLRGQP